LDEESSEPILQIGNFLFEGKFENKMTETLLCFEKGG
jgi:hypothetical protein